MCGGRTAYARMCACEGAAWLCSIIHAPVLCAGDISDQLENGADVLKSLDTKLKAVQDDATAIHGALEAIKTDTACAGTALLFSTSGAAPTAMDSLSAGFAPGGKATSAIAKLRSLLEKPIEYKPKRHAFVAWSPLQEMARLRSVLVIPRLIYGDSEIGTARMPRTKVRHSPVYTSRACSSSAVSVSS